MSLSDLNSTIVACSKCSRLREWCETQEGTKKEFAGETYWSLPVTGFGDQNARVLIVGLAPAAHGANRTGRVFTGDGAGSYLMAALYRHGFANQGLSISRGDSLVLKETFITNIVKCAPPQNKPLTSEFHHCLVYLKQELALLKNLKVILALGGQAFHQTKRILKEFGANTSNIKFGHNVCYELGAGFPYLIGSYHPSWYNINTKRLTPEMLDEVFIRVRELLDEN